MELANTFQQETLFANVMKVISERCVHRSVSTHVEVMDIVQTKQDSVFVHQERLDLLANSHVLESILLEFLAMGTVLAHLMEQQQHIAIVRRDIMGLIVRVNAHRNATAEGHATTEFVHVIQDLRDLIVKSRVDV